MTAHRSDDPAREAAKNHASRLIGLLKFIPGGMARLFGPSILWVISRPLMLDYMPEPQFGMLLFVVFAVSLYWTHLHSKRFK